MPRAELAGLVPDWPAPTWVRTFQSTRASGPLPSLTERLRLPAEPSWLDQVHGTGVVEVRAPGPVGEGDAAFTCADGVVLAVRTADCLPVLFADRQRRCIAVAHAGWRGLAAGVLEATLGAMASRPADVIAWIGPCIGQDAFEVGPEVREAFLAVDPTDTVAFRRGRGDRWHADLVTLARRRLARAGVDGIFGGDWCTFSDSVDFPSFRRGDETERMAALIWMTGD